MRQAEKHLETYSREGEQTEEGGGGGEMGVTNNLVRKSACRHSHLVAAAARTGRSAIRLTEEVSFPSLTNSL